MSRGILRKIDIESYLYKLKNELTMESQGDKTLANKYLNKVLDKLKEYRE